MEGNEQSKLLGFKNTLTQLTTQYGTVHEVHTLGGIGGHSSSSPQAHCKLPKLGLPQFAGNPLDWQGFWDQFRVSIQDKSSVNDIDKFNYLKGCLKGKDQATISGLTLSSENYN